MYFFVARKSETLLCQDFAHEIERKLHLPLLGEVNSFAHIFEYLMKVSQNLHFTLIIDEFQDFESVNTSIFSEINEYGICITRKAN